MKQALQRRIRDGFDIASSGYHDAELAMRAARCERVRGLPYSQCIGYPPIGGLLLIRPFAKGKKRKKEFVRSSVDDIDQM